MQTANIIEMGQITTKGADGLDTNCEIAMVLSFGSREALHAAIRDRVCRLSLFGDGGDAPNAGIERPAATENGSGLVTCRRSTPATG